MKTLKLIEAKMPFSKLFILSMVLCFAFTLLPSSMKAQTPACYYLVHNSTECTATVTVRFYSDCINNTICATITQTIAPNSNAYFNCSPGCNPSTPCNVSVTLDNLGGTTSIGLVVDINSIQNSTYSSDCAIDVKMDWGSSSTLISVGP